MQKGPGFEFRKFQVGCQKCRTAGDHALRGRHCMGSFILTIVQTLRYTYNIYYETNFRFFGNYLLAYFSETYFPYIHRKIMVLIDFESILKDNFTQTKIIFRFELFKRHGPLNEPLVSIISPQSEPNFLPSISSK